jgi:hypothetical protein
MGQLVNRRIGGECAARQQAAEIAEHQTTHACSSFMTRPRGNARRDVDGQLFGKGERA